MSTAPISSSLHTSQPIAAQGNSKPIHQGFRNLANAPNSGDLTGVKDAFSAIQQLLQRPESGKANPSPGSGNKSQNPISTDLAAFGKALLSGDLGAAQDSVKNFLGELQAARGRNLHQAPGGEGVINSITRSTGASQSAGSRSIGSLVNTTA